MISILGKYKWHLIRLGLIMTLVIGGVILTAVDVVLTGMFFMMAAAGKFLLMFLIVFVKKPRKAPEQFRKEIFSLSILGVLLCLLGIGETFESYLILSVVFAEVLLILLVFIFVNFLKKKPLIREERSSADFGLPSWVYWSFLIFNALLLIVFEDQFKGSDQYGGAIVFYFSGLFLLITRWVFNQVKSIIQLKNEKTKTELMHLQSQVNPHFFFNMLNNLYGWVDKDTEKAKELILNISDMMRYSIYDGQKELVTLEEEIQYLKNYIELHKMRYHKEIKVSFNEHIQESNYKVLPLLFIILLENAFKHGVENLRNNAFVNVEMKAQNNTILFKVENNFDPQDTTETGGIGLKNLRRRLELVYPKKHNLSLSSNGKIYTAELTIKLT